MIDRIGDPVNDLLLSGQPGSGTVSVLRTVSEKVKVEAKTLSIAECVRNFCPQDVTLDKTDASPAPSDGRRSGSRCPR
jgi:hypothetical protein